jgi:hypothetical protein
MATTTSHILSLISQLHNIESSFTTILLECALKLSSLTDCDLFIMFKASNESNRVWGASNKDLRELFLSGLLNPNHDDIEFEVDPNVTALIQKPSNQQSYSDYVSQEELLSNNQFQSPTINDVEGYTSNLSQRKRGVSSTSSMYQNQNATSP